MTKPKSLKWCATLLWKRKPAELDGYMKTLFFKALQTKTLERQRAPTDQASALYATMIPGCHISAEIARSSLIWIRLVMRWPSGSGQSFVRQSGSLFWDEWAWGVDGKNTGSMAATEATVPSGRDHDAGAGVAWSDLVERLICMIKCTGSIASVLSAASTRPSPFAPESASTTNNASIRRWA